MGKWAGMCLLASVSKWALPLCGLFKMLSLDIKETDKDRKERGIKCKESGKVKKQ